MTAAAAGRLHQIQLLADEQLDDSDIGVWAEPAAAACKTAFPDRVLLSDERVLRWMLQQEDREKATVVSLNGYKSQTDLRLFMRRIVVKWMFEVTEEQQCQQEVFPLSVIYLDHVVNVMKVTKTRLQLVAAVCMFIASKFRDTVPLSAQSLVIYTDRSITIDDLLRWEMFVLDAMNWHIHHLTPHDFLDLIICRLDTLSAIQQRTVKRHAQTFINVCVIDCKFADCPPSLIALASLYAAITGLMGSDSAVQLSSKLRDIAAIDQELLHYWSDQIDASWQSMVEPPVTVNCNSTESTNNDDDGSPSSRDDVTPAGDDVKSSGRVMVKTPSDIRDIRLVEGFGNV